MSVGWMRVGVGWTVRDSVGFDYGVFGVNIVIWMRARRNSRKSK